MTTKHFEGVATISVDLGDWEDDELCDELRERGYVVGNSNGGYDEVTEMFYAFKLGREDRAMELARKISQDHTGMIL